VLAIGTDPDPERQFPGEPMLKTLIIAAWSAASLLAAGCASQMSGSAPAMMAGGALVAPNGLTLYTFDKDVANSGKSTCNGPCAALWPPMMAGTTDQASGNYSVVTRDDGSRQWAYRGKPVYTYKADQKAGDRAGDNFRDVWHIIKE
jgi:predicted lipoprotein with Yx(FWY)xxD motif